MAKSTLVVDSSQIATFLECPQKWENYYLKRLEPIAMPDTDDALNSGTYGHKLLEIYYRMRARHASQEDTAQAMLAYNPDEDTCECGCFRELHCPVPALDIEECTRCKKCTKFRPHPFKLDTKARKKVYNRIVREYSANYWQTNDFMPLSEQHIEVGFSEPIYEDSANLFVLEGRIDMIAKWQGLDVFVDHKTQTKTHWIYPRSVQFKNYALITKCTTGVINYVRLTDKIVHNETLNRDMVCFNSVEMEDWKKKLVQIFFRIKKAIETKPDRNWNACSGGRLTYDRNKPQYCWYRDLCEEIDPRVAERKEKQLYKIKENIWRPW